MEKAEIRRIVRERISAMSAAERARKGLEAQRLFLELTAYQNAQTLSVYLAMEDEVPTDLIVSEALRVGKRVVAPVVDTRARQMEMRRIESTPCTRVGALGILEPACGEVVSADEIDLVLLPARAIDEAGNRLGRGAGYYDRYLAKTTKAVLCALAFECQRFDDVPFQDHDVPLDMAVTERGVYLCPEECVDPQMRDARRKRRGR